MFILILKPLYSFSEDELCFSPLVDSYHLLFDNAEQTPQNNTDTLTIYADSVWVSSPVIVKPSTAMYHSLAFPGWGQLDNGSKKKAALFLIAETVCIGGYLYMNHELGHSEYSDWEKEKIRTDRNTFLLYWMISKIFGIVDAYVDAQLANYDVEDFTPEELKK